jgi:hypothetical protein
MSLKNSIFATMFILCLIIIGNLCLTAYLFNKIKNIKEVTIKETIKEIREVEVEKIVYHLPELLAVNKEILTKMPEISIGENDIKIIIKSLTETPEKWTAMLGSIGNYFYLDTVNSDKVRVQLLISGMQNGKITKVELREPIVVVFDQKWNTVFHNLVWDRFHTLWTKKTQSEIDVQNNLSNVIENLMDKSQKRDNGLDKLI